MVTVATVITAILYWRCSCFHNSDVLICEVNIQTNAGASQKLLISGVRKRGLSLSLYIIFVDFK
jgi:hypothetical protein